MGLFKNHFYHQLLRKYTIAFGTLFQDIDVLRYSSTNQELSRVTCPLSYSPKEKWLQRIISDPSLSRKPAITLPRLAFEMVDLRYSVDRKLPKLNKLYLPSSDASGAYSAFSPVPYDMMFNLYIAAKTQDDMLQIVEQILPAFVPDYTISIKGITNADISYDVPISISSIEKSDTYDSDVEEGRAITWTIQFLMKGILFGPVRESALIKQAHIEIKDIDNVKKYATVDVEPFLNGTPISEIRKSDNWTVATTIEEIFP